MAAQGETQGGRHQLALKARRELSVAGVQNVHSFDAGMMVLETDAGVLVVKGEDLHVLALDVENGTLSVEGLVHSLEYAGQTPARRARGLLSRLVR